MHLQFSIYLSVFNISLSELSPKYLQDMIEKSDCDYNLRASSHLTQSKCNTVSYGLNSVRYKGPKIWNSFPNYIKEAISLAYQFKCNPILNHCKCNSDLVWKVMFEFSNTSTPVLRSLLTNELNVEESTLAWSKHVTRGRTTNYAWRHIGHYVLKHKLNLN